MITSRRRAVGVAIALAALAALAGCSSGSDAAASADPAHLSTTGTGNLRGGSFATPRQRPSFTLTDTRGASFDFGIQTKGHPTLLYFGYTHCPDICPTTMADISVALKQVPAGVRQQTRVVFITTDPARDTPAAIKQWLGNFDAGLPVPFIGLTGTRRQVDGAQRLAGVPVAQDNGQTHSSEVLLYGIDDMSRDFFLTGTSPSDYSHDLQVVSK